MGVADRQANLQTQRDELVKQHIELDAQQRPSEIYTANANARGGAPCTKVRYQYYQLTAIVTGMIEENSNWDATWDF